MSLEYAILGFLDKVPLSGYDLKKHFDGTVQHFWSADQSQIYRVLARLKKDGMVTQEVVEQEDRPDRKVYHITESGREALNEWLRSAVPFPPHRFGPMIQVFFSSDLSDEELLEIFERNSNIIRKALTRLEQAYNQDCCSDEVVPSERDRFMCHLTLEASKRVMQARLDFSDEVVRKLKNGEFPQK